MPRRAAVHSPSFCPSNRVAHRFTQSTENSISTQSMGGGATSTVHLEEQFRKRLWTRWIAVKLELDPTSIDLKVNSYL